MRAIVIKVKSLIVFVDHKMCDRTGCSPLIRVDFPGITMGIGDELAVSLSSIFWNLFKSSGNCISIKLCLIRKPNHVRADERISYFCLSNREGSWLSGDLRFYNGSWRSHCRDINSVNGYLLQLDPCRSSKRLKNWLRYSLRGFLLWPRSGNWLRFYISQATLKSKYRTRKKRFEN